MEKVVYFFNTHYEPEIRVNAIGLDAIRTHALTMVLTPEIEKRILAHTPLQLLGEADDITGAVLYFAAPISNWISGQVLFVSGVVAIEYGFRADLLVNALVIVELKAKLSIHLVDKTQTLSHLRLMKLPVSLLINFHEVKLIDGLSRNVNNYEGPKPF
jgi:PD-(D/E)XK nuclease superfamily protein/enoyl-ACP reductase-like protein